LVWNYFRLYETEIAPTSGSRTTVDRPLAVVSAVNTSPVTLYVHVDHLNRPVKMTDTAKLDVWSAAWSPRFRARRPARGTRVAGRK